MMRVHIVSQQKRYFRTSRSSLDDVVLIAYIVGLSPGGMVALAPALPDTTQLGQSTAVNYPGGKHLTLPDHIKPDLIRRISPSDRIVREIIYRIVNFRYLMETLAMSDRWLSVEEIAEYLGVSKDTVYAWISKRNMPAHRIGRLWKFKSEEVDEWVRSGGAAENEGRGKE
ncbi:Prophage CP4-57 regulatory protein (AlpA) (modular protein) [Xanthomonas citri pv. citri]|nr:Prophage CP4-57 regulatory protein (AlpA) (modular protein) [Xanthomonas citri pv. citri]CEE27697.1 Prophage CP4-57 regulatory protein (AlpA) (modular protein) [Xanthomonas citri pv. citri]CEE28606.1 Prophage CP4-57 regulatory protein (AlpA) (modular protein) [Xanthomonas citri pv. citri]CEE29589.1 Prophage CP4-57 regulatory protein (AlpA) (modular protein) [Xanthomonas citri pv. citri]CEE36604.1 Prophage CP4-57 regulatory protein (AlpA) (modular protein) [Xanthomonas citri pv. citri]